MNILCWNCRGMGNPWSVRQLRRWSNLYAPAIIFLSETMINKSDIEYLKSRFGFSNAFGVASRGRAGGLCLYWKEDVLFSLVSYSQHHICGDIDDGGKRWRFVGIYGWAKEEEKHRTWTLIRHLCENTTLPILIGGDFNEILSYDEKEGGANRVRKEMDGFRDVMNDMALRDLGYAGLWYTWERGNSTSTCIRERLDRYIGTSSWLDLYPGMVVDHSLRYKSDHSAIILRPIRYRRPKSKKRRYFFETTWLLDASCEDVVKSAWVNLPGAHMTERITHMAQSLVTWSGEKFGKLGKQIAEVEKKLSEIQNQAISDDNCRSRMELEAKLDDLHAKHEAYWYLRSRVAEVRDGDRNTSYFHHKASQRKKRNYVHGLFDEQGCWREDGEDIERIFTDYFSSIFESSNPLESSLDEVLSLIDPVITDDYNQILRQPYTKEEIYSALQQMHPCKAPGPDGMHAIFYQRFWHIVGDDVFTFVSNILHGSLSPSCVNNTNIALIPKVKTPKKAAEFRPIALCNVLYKLVTKALVIRLKGFLPHIVSENQSAFVPGRLITDNALIALEVFHSMKNRNRSRKGVVAMKLDMSKAYDRVEWGFLRKLLLTMGFDGRWVNLIMDCVSSVSYSFIINGGVCGDVIPTRGLRQGDPLSPYLFILVADAFSKMLQKKVQERKIHGAKASRSGPEISHLFFADDSLLFTRASPQECIVIVDILNKYELASGQKINYEKSEVSFSRGVSVEQREVLAGILNMRQVDRHEKYLGIPSISGRSKKLLFDSLLDRIWKKLQGWKEKLLSRAGKETLLKSVIQAIPTYLMGVYKIPGLVIQKIHSAMARFWWGSTETQRKIHWKSWDSLCTLKCFGGMGFKDLKMFNDALLGRQAWRLIREPHSLFARVMKAKYYPHCDFLESSLGYSGSYSWSSIWSSKALIKEGVVWRIGNGSQVKIWEDPWIVDEGGRFLSSARNDALVMVSDLIDFENNEWKLDVIEANFNARDVRCILSIPLSSHCMKDELTWAYTKDACYSVKTAYMLGKGGNLDNFHQAWVDLWCMDVSPKVRHFLWRVCTDTLPVRGLLVHRHLAATASCPWGCGHDESQVHSIFHCPCLLDLWRESGCDELRQRASAPNMCDMLVGWRGLPSEIKIKGAFLAWGIWGARNQLVFNNVQTPHQVILTRVSRWVEEHGKYAKHIYPSRVAHVGSSPRVWSAPPLGIVKLNVDASLAVEGWIGLGVVARDSTGHVLFAATRRVRAHWSAEISEAKAIEMAVRLGRRFGLRDILVESDCQTIVHRLSKNAIFLADLDLVLHNILSSSMYYSSVAWSHVKRDGNSVAHNLAKLIPFGFEQIWENHCPREVAPYVLMDSLSME